MSSVKVTVMQRRIIEALLDKYEKSATFRGTNKVSQSFFVKPESVYPKYADESEYELFTDFNYDMGLLAEDGLIFVNETNKKITKIFFNTDKLNEAYALVNRVPKDKVITEVNELLNGKRQELVSCYKENEIASAIVCYIDDQLERLGEGRLPESFSDIEKYRDLIKALDTIAAMKGEEYIRDVSVRIFNDSKRLEQLRPQLSTILFNYGSFSDREMVMEECGIIRTPSYVMIKGQATVVIGTNRINIAEITGGIAFTSESLADIFEVISNAGRLITIENLTSFYKYDVAEDEIAVYLGGYHNRVKRDFLIKVYSCYPDMEYCHFGDIDAGGFYIYEHLRNRTSIPFVPVHMDRKTLDEYRDYAKPLTGNDRKRIERLLELYSTEENNNPDRDMIIDTLSAMLEYGCKLEQEAVF